MRRSTGLLAALCVFAWAGCSKDENKAGTGKTVETPVAGEDKDNDSDKAPAPIDGATLTKEVGVEAGPIQYDEGEGGAAVVSSVEGTVEIRRVGSESWEPAAADGELREGDQVRTADGGKAVVALADETAVEVAEASAIAIGSREATADPASSVAMLYGVARFTVAGRAAGEGPFVVYTSAGLIASRGTAFGVGVVASGAARVGVETGEVEVAGAAKLDAPVIVASGKAIVIAPEGATGSVEAIGEDDWGAWRDGAEADIEVAAAAKLHAARIAELEAELAAAYAELEAQSAAAAQAEAKAEAAATAGDTAAYVAVAPEISGAVDASFALSLRLQYLSYAMLSHGYVAGELYVRHPDVVPVIEPVRPQMAAAILWHKKYHVVADVELEPIRTYYYIHHPSGRVRARAVGFAVPPFYAKAKLAFEVPPPAVKVAVYRPPVIKPSVKVKKKIWIAAPSVGWYAGVKARIRPAPVKAAWYVKPKAPRARLVFGVRATGRLDNAFAVAPPRPRASAGVRFRGAVGARVAGAAKGGARVKVKAPKLDAKIKAKRPKVDVGAAAGVKAKAKAGLGVKSKVDVKVKKPKIPKPKVKAKGEVKVKGGFKIGN